MYNDLNELKNLRDKTRNLLAKKIMAICNYAINNNFSNILDIYNFKYSNAYNGCYSKKLIIENNDYDIDFCVSFPDENTSIKDITNDIICNNEKPVTINGYDLYCGSYKTPTINQCHTWCNDKINTLAILQNKEINELKEILNNL